ncbi:MAG: mechanosensitive ion channel family protein [Thermaurantiacus sp.]
MAEEPSPADEPASSAIMNDMLALPEATLELTRELWVWLADDSYSALVAIGAALVAYVVLELAYRLLRKFLRSGTPGSYRRMFDDVAGRTMSLFLLLLSLKAMGAVTTPPPLWDRVIGFLFTVVAVVQVARWTIALLVGLIDRKGKVAGGHDPELDGAVGIFRTIIQVVVWLIAGIALLDNLGVNVTALIAGLGVGGIAIGLAAQGIFSDLFAALAIIIDKPFKKGDFISLGGGTMGTVENIGLKSTRIRALSGEVVAISNANLLSQHISNFAEVKRRRSVIVIQVIYQTPTELLERIPGELKTIVEDRPRCTFDRAPLITFAPSGLDYELIFFVEDPALPVLLAEQQAVMLGIVKRFRELGIEFAFPSQTSFLAGPQGEVFDLAEILGSRDIATGANEAKGDAPGGAAETAEARGKAA